MWGNTLPPKKDMILLCNGDYLEGEGDLVSIPISPISHIITP